MSFEFSARIKKLNKRKLAKAHLEPAVALTLEFEWSFELGAETWVRTSSFCLGVICVSLHGSRRDSRPRSSRVLERRFERVAVRAQRLHVPRVVGSPVGQRDHVVRVPPCRQKRAASGAPVLESERERVFLGWQDAPPFRWARRGHLKHTQDPFGKTV